MDCAASLHLFVVSQMDFSARHISAIMPCVRVNVLTILYVWFLVIIILIIMMLACSACRYLLYYHFPCCITNSQLTYMYITLAITKHNKICIRNNTKGEKNNNKWKKYNKRYGKRSEFCFLFHLKSRRR